MESSPEKGHGEELDEEPELPVQALHDMFIDEPADEPDDELDDVSVTESDAVADEERGEVSFGPPLSSPITTPRSRRQPDSSPRHKCTEVDRDTGEPCNADFSRAG